jgi:anti-repressor protein
MNRDGFSLLVMGFTGSEALKFKIDFINAFNQMESKLRLQLPDFTNPAIAARAWADECEAKMLAQAKVKELEPQAEIAKAIVDSRKEYRMSEIAKIMEVLDDDNKVVGRNKFFAALRRAKILMDSNEPYQKYVDLGYFIYKTNVINEYVVNTCFVTGKGLAWLQHNRHKIFN